MIRPLTVLTFLLACGSGLYLYQSKHEVQVLDRTIEKTVRDTTALREQSRLLSAEWTMLNDPERLRQFSDTYLNMKSINPAQFTSLADLNGKLPQIRIAAPEPAAPLLDAPVPDAGDAQPVAAAEPRQPDPADGEAAPAIAAALPVPPVPALQAPAAKAPVVAAVPHQPDLKLAAVRAAVTEAPPRPAAAAEAHPADQRAASAQHQTLSPIQVSARAPAQSQVQPQVQARAPAQSGAPRPIVLAAPRPSPAGAPANRPTGSQVAGNQAEVNQTGGNQPASTYQRQPAPQPYGGSLLGMARGGSMPPAPRPTPVNATYNTN